MIGNPFEKAVSGKPLAIPAQAWNVLMDVAQDRNSKAGGMGNMADMYRRGVLVLVRNDSGADVGQFGVLGIDDIGISPSDNVEAFKSETYFACVTPTTADYTGWFVVTVDPIGDGEIGFAFADGVFPVKVNMVTSGDSWADVKNSDATQLQSSNIGGAAQILWSESGTGTKWAVVRLGNPSTGGGTVPAGTHFELRLTQTGGSAGDATTQCSFTYTAKDLNNVTLGTGMAPEWAARPSVGIMTAATKGAGYYDTTNTFTLAIAYEKPGAVERSCT